MRVLVAIASHGTKNLPYLERVLAEYRSLPYETDIVVVSDAPKDLGPDVEVVVGIPGDDPWTLPFAHRPIFGERRGRYDLYVYAEDDILLTQRTVDAFVEVSAGLPNDEIPGLLRVEKDEQGRLSFDGFHSAYRWLPETARRRGPDLYACHSNDHAGCYLATAKQLETAIDSGGFLVPPHEGRYALLETACNDIYTQCGLTRVVCVSRIDDFTVHHLPNKYVGKWGISRAELDLQIEALAEISESPGAWVGPLVEPESPLHAGAWWKDLYAPPAPWLEELVAPSAEDVLVVGCGDGRLEEALVARGQRVTALPIDPVLSRCARARGIETVHTPLGGAPAALAGRSFDCLVLPHVLQLVPEPARLIAGLAGSLRPEGQLVLSLPRGRDFTSARCLRTAGPAGAFRPGLVSLGADGWRARMRVRRWLRGSGFEAIRIAPILWNGALGVGHSPREIYRAWTSRSLAVAARR